MKKRLSWILLPVFAIALLLGLASCSNAYSGNYKEVTAEDLTAVEEKLANAEVEAPKTTVYELTSSANMSMDYSNLAEGFGDFSIGVNGSAKCEAKVTSLTDETNKLSYSKLYVNASSKMGDNSSSLVGNIETWISGEEAYVNADVKGTGEFAEFTVNKKVKGTTSQVEAVLGGVNNVTESFLSGVNTNISLDEFLEALGGVASQEGFKLYQDGNKYKLEMTQGSDENQMKMNFYLIINENKTYQMMYEVPQFTSGGMSMAATAELKPTTKTINMPNANDFTPAN